ncbi:transposable element Tc1 transposase [Trichonephila clavipes]|nr:transposable element Tc1 transposase [Trichonephila clavipes]
MLNGHTYLHVFTRGTVTAVGYKDEVHECLREAHRAHLVDEFLEREDIHRMDWPFISSDLIRMEHVWNALGRSVVTRKAHPRTIQGLKTESLNVRSYRLYKRSCTSSFIPNYSTRQDLLRAAT